MQNRQEKAKSILYRCSRGNAVELKGFPVPMLAKEILQTLIPFNMKPVIVGGCLREAFMSEVLGVEFLPKDYDLRATFPKNFQGLDRLLDDMKEKGFVINPIREEGKQNPETLTYKGESVSTLRMLFKGVAVDIVMVSNLFMDSRAIATSGDTAISSVAMGGNHIVYADPNFEYDAKNGVIRITDSTDKNYIEDRIAGLQKKYGQHFQTIVSPSLKNL